MSEEVVSLKKLLIVIALVSFSVMFSISVVGPLLNEIAIAENIPLGSNPNTVLGLIFSSGTLALALFQVPFAVIADKIGRKKTVFIGTLFLAIVVFLIGYVGDLASYLGLKGLNILSTDASLLLLGILRILQGVFAAATWPILMALILVYFKEENIGFAMGVFGASFGLGMSLGPVIGLALEALSNIHTPFILSALLGLVSTFAIMILPREKKVSIKRERRFIMDKRLIILSLIAFMLLYTMGSIVVIYPRFMRNILNMTVKDVAIAMAAASLTYTFLQPLAGRVADKVDKRILILVASIPFIPVISIFGFLHQLNGIVISMALFGVLGGFIFPASNSLVGVIAPEGMENIYSGFYNMMLSLGVTVSPIIIGILSDTLGYGYAYISNGVLMTIVLLLFIALWKEFKG